MGIDRAGPVGGFRIVTSFYFTDIVSTFSFPLFICFMFWEGVGRLRGRVGECERSMYLYAQFKYFTY
jgi:hypothetical protein